MRVFVLIFAVIVVASAVLTDRRHVHVEDDGTVKISTEDGKYIVIRKPTPEHHRFEIVVSGPNVPTKHVLIDEHNHWTEVSGANDVESSSRNYRNTIRSHDEDHEETDRPKREEHQVSQLEFLGQLLKTHQGYVDDATYHLILSQVRHAVDQGILDVNVYHHLRSLIHEHLWNQLIHDSSSQHGQSLDTLSEHNVFGGNHGPSALDGESGPYSHHGLYNPHGDYNSYVHHGEYPPFTHHGEYNSYTHGYEHLPLDVEDATRQAYLPYAKLHSLSAIHTIHPQVLTMGLGVHHPQHAYHIEDTDLSHGSQIALLHKLLNTNEHHEVVEPEFDSTVPHHFNSAKYHSGFGNDQGLYHGVPHMVGAMA